MSEDKKPKMETEWLNNLEVTRFSSEVLFSRNRVLRLQDMDIAALKDMAIKNRRKAVRLCTHKDIDAVVHEMFLVYGKDMYVRPHKHLNKAVSFLALEGEADVLIFDNAGCLVDIFPLGGYGSKYPFYGRLEENIYYCQYVRSEIFVFHEVIGGPFIDAENVWAEWSPEKQYLKEGREFLERKIESYKTRSHYDR
jgi:cupin fold WbuC family metalloprotein